MRKRTSLAIIPLLWLPLTFADWALDNDRSNVSFVTTKATHISEVNGFDHLGGTISKAGKAEITIDLSSVNTAIPVRDGRLQEHLFDVARYANATITAEVDAKALGKLDAGESSEQELVGTLNLHGVTLPVNVPVTVVKQNDDSLLVVSKRPLLLNASSVDLADGVEKLRELAGLPSISLSVTVTFQLTFAQL